MTQFTTLTKRITVALAVAVLALTVGNAVQAAPKAPAKKAPAAPKAESLVGMWKTPTTLADGTQAMSVMMLEDDGTFKLGVFNSDVELLSKIEGTYTYERGVLTITVDGEERTMQVQSASSKTLVTTNGQKKTTWQRVEK